MFETSSLLLLNVLFYNIFLPLLPGILFLWICFSKRFTGMLLYLLGWCIGVGVVAFSLFNLQFFHFGIGVNEYLVLLVILFLVFLAKNIYQKTKIKDYFSTLKIKNIIPQIKKSFAGLSLTEKIFTLLLGLFVSFFLLLSFIHTTKFPTSTNDSFYNRNGPAYTIYLDGGVHMFGAKTEILAKGRLGYPIYIPIYKAVVTHFLGEFNDIYINIWQWLVCLVLFLFVFTTTFTRTKNIFYSLLPIGLIAGLPLVYFHATEGYMELSSALYAFLAIWAFWKFLEEKEYSYLSLGLLAGFILSYIKNDGFIVYFPAILIAFIIVLLLQKSLIKSVLGFFKNRYQLILSGVFFLFFFLPFLLLKSYYHLGFNQAAGLQSGFGISPVVHRNIFSAFPEIFIHMDNYNLILILLFLLFSVLIGKWKTIPVSYIIFILAPIFSFVFLLLVFLLTNNYAYFLDQITVNRIFTVVFVLFISFSGYIFAVKGSDG